LHRIKVLKNKRKIKTVTKMLKKDLVNKYEALSSEESRLSTAKIDFEGSYDDLL
jgi:hypothetical protein